MFSEAGPFNWPTALASFCQCQHSQAGVLFDIGVHALNLACWWFGKTNGPLYHDDAMRNMEGNCHLSLESLEGLAGEVRLSRDTPPLN